MTQPSSPSSPLAPGMDHLLQIFLDKNRPASMRAKMLAEFCKQQPEGSVEHQQFLTCFFEAVAQQGASEDLTKARQALEQALNELQEGPWRPASFVEILEEGKMGLLPRVHVITPDGHERFPLLSPQVNAEELGLGMTVYLDAKGAAIVGSGRDVPRVGREATFLRRLPESNLLEVSLHEESIVVYAAKNVIETLDTAGLRRGDRVLICPNRQFAFGVLPATKDRSHRFIDSSKVPEVIPSRDIGNPHWVLGYMLRRFHVMLFRQDLLQRYELRPRVAVMMTGPSGTGKTLAIRAFLHLSHQMLQERVGRTDIPSRVVRVKTAELLSEWYGRTDKNIEELFDDIQYLAGQEFTTADGSTCKLPVTVILEEAEGLAKRRGEHDGGVYDRTLGTLLQRMDDPTDDLSQLPIMWITTSNRPDMIDSAMYRRLGAIQAPFQRLDRQGLVAVLNKKLKPGYPYASENGHAAENGSPADGRRELIDRVVAAMYSTGAEDDAVVEITLRDGTRLHKHRRDFLTGAVVEQAVAAAIDELVFATDRLHEQGIDGPVLGLSPARMVQSLRHAIDGIAENLTAHNVHDYLSLPEHTTVANIRRLRKSGGPLLQAAN